MTAQHPAAPETETDANGQIERLGGEIFPHLHAECDRLDADLLAAVVISSDWLAACVAERVRVVEGERDFWKAEREVLLQQQPFRVAESNRLRAESAEAAHEAEKAAHERRVKRAEALLDAWEHDAPGLVDPVFAGRLREVLRRDPAPVRLREDNTLAGGGAR